MSIPAPFPMADTRGKGAIAKPQQHFCSAEGAHNTQPQSDHAFIALEQELICNNGLCINFLALSCMQQACLTKAEFSASMSQFLVQLTALIQPSLSRATKCHTPSPAFLSLHELEPAMLAQDEVDTDLN